MKLYTVHYLRGFAALLVVVAHNSFLLSGEWIKNIPGALGVDIYFLLLVDLLSPLPHKNKPLRRQVSSLNALSVFGRYFLSPGYWLAYLFTVSNR